jgi:Saxitoxin biosynthesis operon protein SxtJ
MSAGQNHEGRVQAHNVKMGSERGFGAVFAVVFSLIGIWPAISIGWRPRFDPTLLRWWALAISGTFLTVAIVYPASLRPLNRLWFRFGMLLSRVTTPIVMGLLFVLAVIPTAIVMRLRGHDLMRLKLDRQAKSYWIVRDPPGPSGQSMKNQY